MIRRMEEKTTIKFVVDETGWDDDGKFLFGWRGDEISSWSNLIVNFPPPPPIVAVDDKSWDKDDEK